MTELESVTRWRMLGTHLRVARHVLDTVEGDKQDIENRKMEMLSRWIRSTPEAAWEGVVSALRRMNEILVAEHIGKTYCAGGQDNLHPVTGNNMKCTVI